MSPRIQILSADAIERMAGNYRSTETLYGSIPVIQNNNPSDLLTLPQGTGMTAGVPPLSSTERERLNKQITDLRTKRADLAKNKQFASLEFVQNGILLNTFEAKLRAYEADGTPKVLAMGVRDRKVARDSELFIRGEVEKPRATVPRGFVQVLCSAATPTVSLSSGRLELRRMQSGIATLPMSCSGLVEKIRVMNSLSIVSLNLGDSARVLARKRHQTQRVQCSEM